MGATMARRRAQDLLKRKKASVVSSDKEPDRDDKQPGGEKAEGRRKRK